MFSIYRKFNQSQIDKKNSKLFLGKINLISLINGQEHKSS